MTKYGRTLGGIVTTAALAAGLSVAVAAPASAAPGDCAYFAGYGAACFWKDAGSNGSMTWTFTGQSTMPYSFNDTVTAIRNNYSSSITIYEDTYSGGRHVAIAANGWPGNLAVVQTGLNWWESWNDRMSSNKR